MSDNIGVSKEQANRVRKNPWIRTAMSWSQFREKGILKVDAFTRDVPEVLKDGKLFQALVLATVYSKPGRHFGMHLFLAVALQGEEHLLRGYIPGYASWLNKGDSQNPHFNGIKHLEWGSMAQFKVVKARAGQIPVMEYPQGLREPDADWEIPKVLRGIPKA